MRRTFWMAWLACAFVALAGCAITKKKVVVPARTHPALTATKSALIARYNREASAIETLSAAVRMSPAAGSALSGVIEQYHHVNGYILAARPASIRVIGQAPIVAKDIFDMASDGRTFRIYIPSKNKFIIGPTNLQRTATKPIENLRPQHLFDALLWKPIPEGAPVLFEQVDTRSARYYVLTVARNDARGWTLDRKIWFDRADLRMVRIQIYGSGGELVSDIRATDWQPAGSFTYPRDILLARPADEYQLDIQITQLTLNEPIASGKFQLAQPAGTELVRLGAEAQP